MAIQLRTEIGGECRLAAKGALSIAFGNLPMRVPLVGAIVLGLWIGAYALVLAGTTLGCGRTCASTAELAA